MHPVGCHEPDCLVAIRATGAESLCRLARQGSYVPSERSQDILRFVQQEALVTVAQLAAHFGVSRASIPRHLNDLHNSRSLQRMYPDAPFV